MVDPNAGELTKNLYANLHALAGNGVMFGHQATLDYGYTWTQRDLAPGELRSDVKDVSGSFPAVYGWDVNHIVGVRLNEEQRKNNIQQHLDWNRGIFERGGVITYEWHMYHPASGQSFYDTSAVVHRIIPGGDLHHVLTDNLDLAALFFRELAPVPVIFRPWHEHNGDWFWWCKGSTSEEDFITLWQFTVEYLRDVKKLDNLIYAYSPDRSRIDIDNFEEGYHWGYPGDEYVDIIGIDNYWDLGHPVNEATPEEQLGHLRRTLQYTVEIANKKGKVAALTETGLEAIPNPTWWTDIMLTSLLHDDKTKQITYFLVWRNATKAVEQRDHYYAPFPGQVSADDFVEFRAHPHVLLEDDLPNMYRKP
jgi:mannan endo-1,4-beta-mannosidase